MIGTTLSLEDISIEGTQTRAALREQVVKEYAESLGDGAEFPPVDVFLDGSTHHLSAGFHRYFAHKRAGRTDIACKIHKGTKWDAIKFGIEDNAKQQGERITSADKRHQIGVVLASQPEMTDSAIAKLCGVTDKTVAKHRPKSVSEIPKQRQGADGKQYNAEKPATTEAKAKVLEQGSLALKGAVERGEVNITTAAKLADLPKLEQAEVLKAGPAAVKAAVAKTTEKPPKPVPKKAGKPTVDLRKFAELEKELGKCVRLNTAIKEHCGGADYHEEIRQHLNDSLKVLAKWRKGSGAA